MNDYNVDFQIEDGILYVRLTGTFPTELLHKYTNLFQPLIDECAARQCKKVLIDARDLQVAFKVMNLFRAGEDAASLANLDLKVAFTAREDMIDPFFENVAYNRGGHIGVFTDIDGALSWLNGDVRKPNSSDTNTIGIAQRPASENTKAR